MTYREKVRAKEGQGCFRSIEILLGKQETFATQIKLIDKKLSDFCCVPCQTRWKLKRKGISEQLDRVNNRMSELIGKLNKNAGNLN